MTKGYKLRLINVDRTYIIHCMHLIMCLNGAYSEDWVLFVYTWSSGNPFHLQQTLPIILNPTSTTMASSPQNKCLRSMQGKLIGKSIKL